MDEDLEHSESENQKADDVPLKQRLRNSSKSFSGVENEG